MKNWEAAAALTATDREYRRHVEEADRRAHTGLDGDYHSHEDRMRLFGYAQVHATLALAAQVERLADILDASRRASDS